jgi:hypothetical protein
VAKYQKHPAGPETVLAKARVFLFFYELGTVAKREFLS